MIVYLLVNYHLSFPAKMNGQYGQTRTRELY